MEAEEDGDTDRRMRLFGTVAHSRNGTRESVEAEKTEDEEKRRKDVDANPI